MQFAVTAYDHPGADTLALRMQHREAHLAGLVKSIEAGNFLSGGALLDTDGKMMGSSLHVEFDDRAALDTWIANDPFSQANVWGKIEIQEVRLFSPA